MSDILSMQSRGVEEELYDACVFTVRRLLILSECPLEIGQALLSLVTIGPDLKRQAKALALAHDEELEPIKKISIGTLADIGVTLKAVCLAYEKRAGTAIDLGKDRLAELLEHAEVKSETMDAPSHLAADTDNYKEYVDLFRECANEIKGLTAAFVELRSGFSMQMRMKELYKIEIPVQERQEEHTRRSRSLLVEEEPDKAPQYAWVRRRKSERERRRSSPKRVVGVKEMFY